MRSAGLSFDADGRVAWDQIWQSFCDLALAGGPPHKGRLLAPGRAEDVASNPDAHLDVVEELARGITLASELPTDEAPDVGWIRVMCHSEVMAGWMLRAITMENVAVQQDGRAIDLPAAPWFRVEKEVKNVVTVVAKTSHYWMGHMPREQRIAVASLLETLERESPLIAPDWSLPTLPWRAVECASVAEALDVMRLLVTVNVLARREETTLLVPINPAIDPDGTHVDAAVAFVRATA